MVSLSEAIYLEFQSAVLSTTCHQSEYSFTSNKWIFYYSLMFGFISYEGYPAAWGMCLSVATHKNSYSFLPQVWGQQKLRWEPIVVNTKDYEKSNGIITTAICYSIYNTLISWWVLCSKVWHYLRERSGQRIQQQQLRSGELTQNFNGLGVKNVMVSVFLSI